MTLDINLGQIVIAVAGVILTAVFGFFSWLVKKALKDIEQLKLDSAVIASRVGEALAVRTTVINNTERIVRLEEREKVTKSDVNALHVAKREILQKMGQPRSKV